MGNEEDFTTTITVDRTPQEVFAAVTDPRGWWSQDITGGTGEVGDEFTYVNGAEHHCTMKLTEVVPAEKVNWRVLENYFSFTEDRTEWTGTDIAFEISENDEGTELRFTHHGLGPEYECFDLCTKAWGFYIRESLRDLITTGTGKPNPKAA
jgi:uncharacterized protein YndB with AHSA1/START domain